MKKIISLALVVLMALAAFTACGDTTVAETTVADTVVDTTAVTEVVEAATVKFGMGVYAAYGDNTSAEGDTNGNGEVAVTIAAVLVDENGKIVKCDIDTADLSVAYTSAGVAVVADEFKTKAELGTAYGMSAYGTDLNGDGKVLEWNEQIDVFENAIAGKTLDEAKALVVNGYQAVEEVQTAGCTMGVAGIASALVKAAQ